MVIFFTLALERPSLRAEETEEPVQLTANRLQYFKKTDTYFAEGAVSIEQGTMRLKADTIRLKGATGDLKAFGHIHYFDGIQTIDADRIAININTKLGILYNGKLFIKEENYHIEGKEMVRRRFDQYALYRSSFTACDCEEDPAWRFRAEEIRLTLDEYLFAKNVFFYANEVPVLYLPYFVYPVKSGRQTGLLVPKPGYSSRYGFRYQQDFFWAMSQNQDATISLEHRGNKGDGLGLEYRYVLSKKARGELETRYFRDKEKNVDRWQIRYRHAQQFTERIRARLNLRYVNQNDHFQDLSDQTVARSLQNIESNLSLTYRGEASFAYLLARYTQDLTSISNNETPQRLPEVGYNLIEYRLGDTPLLLNIDTTAVNFWSEGGLNLQRIDLYPKLSLPVSLGKAATLTPWAGFRETWYRHGESGNDPISREIAPIGLRLESLLSRSWDTLTHVVNPSIGYENILVSDNKDIQQIDEIDTLHDRESLTFSLMQRLLKKSGSGSLEEKASFRLTETYDLGKVSSSAAPAKLAKTRRFSDLRGELHLRPWEIFSVSVDTFYNHDEGQISSWNTDLELAFKPYLSVAIGQRRTRAGSIPIKGDLFNALYLGNREVIDSDRSFLSERIIIDSPWGIRFENRAYFDEKKKELVEIDYILQYQAQCWGIGLSYLDFRNRNELSFVITLKGLGGFIPRQ